jgi:hypothetical protein
MAAAVILFKDEATTPDLPEMVRTAEAVADKPLSKDAISPFFRDGTRSPVTGTVVLARSSHAVGPVLVAFRL